MSVTPALTPVSRGQSRSQYASPTRANTEIATPAIPSNPRKFMPKRIRLNRTEAKGF